MTRVLTINRHEIYIKTLAQLQCHLDVLVAYKDLSLPWRTCYGDPSENMSLVSWGPKVEKDLVSHQYQFIILHTVDDLVAMRKYVDHRFIFVIHLALYTHTVKYFLRSIVKKAIVQFMNRSRGMRVVAISSWKKSTWKLDYAEVVKSTPLVVLECNYENRQPRIITVGNHFKTRHELNWPLLRELQKKFPIQIVGNNPDLPGALLPRSREELLKCLQESDIFIFTTQRPWEDGYNLAVLEAMAAGLAIVSLENPSSPVEHGRNGFLAKNQDELNDRIDFLLRHPELVKEFGQRSREIVQEQFARSHFVDNWNRILCLP